MNSTKADENFKAVQQRYRQVKCDGRWWTSDETRDLIDFSEPSLSDDIVAASCSSASYNGPLFTLREYNDGFFFAPNALSKSLQLKLAARCLMSYCEPPHDTNIDQVPPKVDEVVSGVEIDETTMWERHCRGSTGQNKHYRSIKKLAWATNGWNYDWTLRKYHEGKISPFPENLTNLGKIFGGQSFNPQASIINFYHSKSLMGGHQDDLELTFEKPVVSFSLGVPCVFLLGGLTKDEKPTPILVRPGDVLVMGGGSRLRFHGMARLLVDCSLPDHVDRTGHDQIDELKDSAELSQKEEEEVERYLKNHRININVRQVLPDEGRERESGQMTTEIKKNSDNVTN